MFFFGFWFFFFGKSYPRPYMLSASRGKLGARLVGRRGHLASTLLPPPHHFPHFSSLSHLKKSKIKKSPFYEAQNSPLCAFHKTRRQMACLHCSLQPCRCGACTVSRIQASARFGSALATGEGKFQSKKKKGRVG